MTKLCAAPAHNIISALQLAQTIMVMESFASEILRFIALVCVKFRCRGGWEGTCDRHAERRYKWKY